MWLKKKQKLSESNERYRVKIKGLKTNWETEEENAWKAHK